MEDWLKGAISAGLGAAFGIAAEPIKRFVNDYFGRLRLQRAIYYEIADMYRWVARVLGYAHGDYKYEEVFPDLQKALESPNYKNAKARPDLFYDIPHFSAVEAIYYHFGKLALHPGKNNWACYMSSARYALKFVEQRIAKNEIDLRLLLEVCPDDLKERFRELAIGLKAPFWDETLQRANAIPIETQPPRDWPIV